MPFEDDIARRRADLTPEKRALFDARLQAARQTTDYVSGIKRQEDRERRLLSFAQQQHWVLNRLHPGNPAYNVPRAYRLTGPLNVMALVRGLNELVRRHDTLRTTFSEDDHGPVPVVADMLTVAMPLQDLSHVPSAEGEPHARAIAVEEAGQPFDLERGPLFRAQLLALSQNDHVLLLTMHHIIADDASMGVALGELLQLYQAFCHGNPSPLPPLPIRYTDYAAWLRQRQTENVHTQDIAYFREQLEGAPPALALPYDHPRPSTATFRGAGERLVIPPTLVDALTSLGRQNGATLFMLLMTAFHVLLQRYCRQNDIVVGFPVAGRNRIETEGLIGLFVNTLVLRTDMSGNPRFEDLVSQVRERVVGALAHQDMPFVKLVEALQPDRASSEFPVFHVMFNLEDVRGKTMAIHELSVREFDYDAGLAPLDLVVEARRTDEGLSCTFTYSIDLFEAATIQRMCGHFRTLLHAVVEDPGARVSELPLLTPAERHQVLVAWNDTRMPFPQNQCLHQLVEAQAARTPDAVALVFGDERIAYRELDRRANGIAARLLALGLGPNPLVGIYLLRSTAMVVGVLATLKAGGAYVPLDPSYPHVRLNDMLQDAQVRAIVTHVDLLPSLPANDAHIVEVNRNDTPSDVAACPNPVAEADVDDLAYVIYTSGSTGRPKGVAIAHRSACAFVHWARSVYDDADLRGVLCATSISFDLFVFELFVPLSWGGTVILAENVLALQSLAARDEVSLVNTVPSAMAALVRHGTLPGSVRTANLAGEPFQPALVDRLYDLGVRRVFDLYGPTETTTYSTFTLRRRGGPMTVGRPIANTRLYLLNECREPVPIGVPGEVYIGGAGVAHGYLHRSELTAEKFVPDPFVDVPGQRMYATGDLARYLPDGNIQLIGRLDHQVKIRGFRIELEEIEHALATHPSVREVVVAAREDQSGDRRLVAYVAGTMGATDESSLREILKVRLPEYMIPAAFVFLDALPRTPNGKVDRKGLPAPLVRKGAISEGYVAPRTACEEALARIWAELLRVPRVSVYDNFFELGGHSLLGARVVSHIQKTLDRVVPLQTLFESPTVAQLAAYLDESSEDSEVSTLPRLERVSRQGLLPLSFAQERLWVIDRLQPGLAVYNIANAYRISGTIEPTDLDRALEEIVRRHEILRTTFPSVNGRPSLAIAPQSHVALPVDDLRTLPSFERENEALRLAVDEACRPFDLGTGPLFRVRLLRLDGDTHILVVVIHHIVMDGWSRSLFIRELFEIYGACAGHNAPPRREYAIQYADFAEWQRKCLLCPGIQGQRTYWSKRLGGPLPAVDLPADRPRPVAQTFRGAIHGIKLSREITGALRQFSHDEGVTLFMSLLAAFQTLLHRYTGLDDIIVGVPIGNRPRVELENLVGLFVNTLAVRTDFSDNPSFRDMLQLVKSNLLGAYANQDMPFEKLVDELHVRRDPSRAPLVQVMFAFQNFPDPPLTIPGLRIESQTVHTMTAKLDLTLFLYDKKTGLEGSVEYNTDLFDASTIVRISRHFENLLGGIVAAPNCRVSDLPLLSTDERRQMIVTWNETASAFPEQVSAHSLFEAQAEATPDAVAIVHGDDRLTYSDLNARANQLAHHLHDLGVEPGQLVGIGMERSAAMLVGVVGILKAGGAYVPLSADYPQERLAWMLLKTQARVIVTHTELLQRLPVNGQTVVCLDADESRIAQKPNTSPGIHVSGDDLAYVAFTSGSTGTPQGVCVPHKAINRLVVNTNYIRLDRSTVVAQASTIAFDAATFEVWGALAHGARLVILSKNTLLSPNALEAAIAQYQIGVLFVTTALFNHLAQLAPAAFHGLKYLLFGGEAASPRWVREIVRHGAPERLLHVYGPTEATTFTTSYPVDDIDEDACTVPIGRPIANTEVYVLDGHMQPVPIGVTGELCIGGPGLACGYLDDPELTASKFVRHPFDRSHGARMYRTGDMVRYLHDGIIEFIGRRDSQTKIRGYRIELGEIEAALVHHPDVREAVVLCREDAPGDKRLAAYIVAELGRNASPESLRAFLKSKLPDYMLPAAFVPLHAFPQTAHGKIDRSALPAPNAAISHDTADTGTPRDASESMLKEVWEEVLKVRPIGLADNFFDIGGNSILAVQLFSQIEKATGKSLPVSSLFLAPTIEQLADVLRRNTVYTTHSPLVLIRPEGDKPPLFWIHSVTGRVELYYHLVRQMGTDRPMVGVQAFEEPLHRIEAMAAAYAQEIRRAQPQGPYHLAGHCFGGVVAFEIARHLEAEKQTVGFLGLLESVAPNTSDYRLRHLPLLALRALGQLPVGLPGASRPSTLDAPQIWRKLRRGCTKLLRHVVPQLRPAHVDIDEVFHTSEFWEGHQALVRIHAQALVDYVPQPFSGKVTLFKAHAPSLAHLDPYMGWSKLAAGGVDVRLVPGAHGNMLEEPYLDNLAHELQDLLNRADELPPRA